MVLLSMVVLAASPVRAQSSETIHVVRPGETLSSIAAQYGISYLQLARYNNITNVNHLRVGQRLRIPPRTTSRPTARPRLTPTKAPTNNKSPTPRAGATKAPANPRITPRPQTPTPIPTRRLPNSSLSGGSLYTVRRGDTLSSIAARYGVTVAAIMQRNRMTSSVIYVGQRLIIPARGSSGASPPRSTPRPTPKATRATTTPPTMRATSTPTRMRLIPTAQATPSRTKGPATATATPGQ